MPAPRFGRTPAARPGPTSAPGADTTSALAEWGFAESEIRALLDRGIAFESAAEAG
jgi:alpha-methylacyl-CoA racemase